MLCVCVCVCVCVGGVCVGVWVGGWVCEEQREADKTGERVKKSEKEV